MKCKILAWVLAVSLLSGAVPASADSPQRFSDVLPSFWAYEPIMEMADAGIINGTGKDTFSPSMTVTSAQFLTLVGRLAFPDVKVGVGESWYAPYVEAAKNAGWLNGTLINSMQPVDNGISRYDMAVILSRAGEKLGFTTKNVDVDEIKDYDRMPDHYRPFVKTVYGQGLIKGNADGDFMGANTMTRAEVAMVIWRMEGLKSGLEAVSDLNPTTRLSSEQISDKCAPAVFYVDVYALNGSIAGSGSGFFISADGLAVTNFHVAANSSLLVITTQDGKKYSDVKIIDADEDNDLVLLKVGGGTFPYLELGDSSAVKQGQNVYAIGSPRGLDNTMSTGIISNPVRVLENTTYIQISVPIAPGSSGGALIDEYGKVIGVTTAGYANSTGDLNLAIPSGRIAGLDRDSKEDLVLFAGDFYSETTSVYDFGSFSGVKEISVEPYAYGWTYSYDVFDFHEGDGSLDPADCYVYTCQYYQEALLEKGFKLSEVDASGLGGTFYSDEEIVDVDIDLNKRGTIEITTYRIPQGYKDLTALPDFGWYTFLPAADEGYYNGSFMYQYIWSDYYPSDAFYALLELYFDLLEEEGYSKQYDSGSMVLYEGNGVSAVFDIGETDLWIDAQPLSKNASGTDMRTDKDLSASMSPASVMNFPWYLYSNDGKQYLGKLTTNKYDSESIWNEYGTYGNKYQSNSIWNKYGTYGSAYSSESAFNKYATTPPKVVDKDGYFVCYLTENEYLNKGYSITVIRQLLLNYGQ